MKPNLLMTVLTTCLLIPAWSWSEPKHAEKQEHAEHGKNDKHEEHEGHGEEEGHEHGEEEAPPSVGPEKGILEASESAGIKLSPEALKNFEIKTRKLSGSGPWSLPLSARFQSGEETNLFRLRSGFFKRIDFAQTKRDAQQFIATSKELRDGDEVVVAGIGFLRIAEVTAFGGAPEGHSH